MKPRPNSPAVWRAAALLVILAVGALLRFYGLRWALPNDIHDYTYHPDEFLTVGAAFGRIVAHRTIDPGLYNYPSLYIYLSALAIMTGFAYGAADKLASVYLAARTVTALMGTAAVAVTYWAGKVNFGPAAGIIAALMICVAPIHVQHSHFATVDVPSTLFVAAALGFAGLILKEGAWKSYLLGGAMSGLAAGTKYNAGLVLLSLVAANLLRRDGRNRLLTAIGCAVAAFVISTPGSVLHPDKFLYGLTYEMRHAATGHGLVFLGTGNGFVYTFASSLWYGLGPQVLLFLPAVLLALVRKHRPALVVLAFLIPYYILISSSQVRFARYALPMFPAIAILVGWFVVEVSSRINSRTGRGIWAVCCGAILFWTLLVVLHWTTVFGVRDPRDLAASYVKAVIPAGSCVGRIEVPWYYSPPLTKDLGFGTLSQRVEAMHKAPYKLRPITVSHTFDCDWAIISDYETRDAARLAGKKTIPRKDQGKVASIAAQIKSVETDYVPVRRYKALPDALAVLGFPNPPHDMRYVGPEIMIYERKK